MTKNLHLEHPEDLLLTGNLWVLEELFNEPDHTSVKIDGAPAIVWGVDPATGDEFVGTKSVFNKRKIKICYSLEDIQKTFSLQAICGCWRSYSTNPITPVSKLMELRL